MYVWVGFFVLLPVTLMPLFNRMLMNYFMSLPLHWKMNGIVSHVSHICLMCIRWRWLLYQCCFVIRSFHMYLVPKCVKYKVPVKKLKRWAWCSQSCSSLLWQKWINSPGNQRGKKCLKANVFLSINLYCDPACMRAFASLSLLNIRIEKLAKY